jgi:hypothetical protein
VIGKRGLVSGANAAGEIEAVDDEWNITDDVSRNARAHTSPFVIPFSDLLANDVGEGLTIINVEPKEPTYGLTAVMNGEAIEITYGSDNGSCVGCCSFGFDYTIRDQWGQMDTANVLWHACSCSSCACSSGCDA